MKDLAAEQTRSFSAKLRMRALGAFCAAKSCSVKDVSDALGSSRATAARIMRSLSKEKIIKKQYYRPISRRGVRPDRYCFSDNVACLLIDARKTSPGIFFYSVPELDRTEVLPKVRSDRASNDRLDVLIDECVKEIGEQKRIIISTSIISDTGASPWNEAISNYCFSDRESVCNYTEDMITARLLCDSAGEAALCVRERADSVELFCAGRGSMSFVGSYHGADLFSLTEKCSGDIAKAAKTSDRIVVIADGLCVDCERMVIDKIKIISGGSLDVSVFDSSSFDVRRAAVKYTLEELF